VITGALLTTVTSNNAFLVINTAPAIITQPANQTASTGTSVSFSVTATGTGLTYQWRKGVINLTDGGNISGATTDTLTINPVNVTDAATNYNVVISGPCSPITTSNYAALTVNTAPGIITEPSDQTACTGSSVNFTVTATGSGLTYQWRKGTVNLTNIGNITGATTTTLTISSVSILDAATDYNVVINGTYLPVATSANVSLTVNTSPNITTQPANQTAGAGNSVSISVVATGTALTYQWRKGVINLTNGGSVSGATTATLTINPVNVTDAAANYNVVISGTCSPITISTNATLTVNTAPGITTEPYDQTACIGSPVSFSVTATGSGLTYQWRKGVVNLTNVGNITGATTATLTISSVSILDAATDYNVVINGTYLPSATSVNVSLTVNTSPEITAQPLNQVAGVGNSVSFSVTATGSGLTYQWRKGVINLINGGNISGATTATLTINPVNVTDASTNYNVVISGTCSPITNSSNAILTVNTAPNIITGPSDQTACTGGSVSFSVAATGSGLTFQWRKGTVNLTDVGNIVGATTATMIIISVSIYDAATDYNVVINGTYLPSATSANVSLTVNTSPNITAQPASQTAYSGNLVSFSVTATGTGLSYQWRKGNVNLINGGNISGATSATLNFNPVVLADAAPDYNVLVTGACPPISTSVNTSLIVCCPTAIDTIIAGNPDKIVNIYPNPFSTTVNIVLNSEFQNDKLEFRMYNVLGVEEMHTRLTKKITTLETGDLHSGIYFYIIYRNNKSIQTGRLVSQF